MPSSDESDGRRPFIGAMALCRFGTSRGKADGQSVVRDGSDFFESRLGRVSAVLKLSEEAFLFSRISPPPAMMTGLILSRRNGS